MGSVSIAATINGLAVTSAPPTVTVANGVWAAAGGGTFNWGDSGNWQGGVPDGPGDVAVLGPAVGSGTATITLDAIRTLSDLTFSPGAGGSYAVSGSGNNVLQLASSGSSSSISVAPAAMRSTLPSCWTTM